MENWKRRLFSLGIVIAIFVVALASGFFSVPFAVAEDEDQKHEDAQEEKARGEYKLETMTVTAEKQEENVQDVPVSITAFDEQDIEDKNIESLGELADFVPNFLLNYDGASGMNSPAMRGIYVPAEFLTVSTGLFIDGVPILTSTGFEYSMLDIERVEVLRGPQGTLYGKNTEAGAINIITRQPDNDFRGKLFAEAARLLSAETGDRLKDEFTLNLSGPIQTDKLFFGIAGKFYQKDGFMENTTTGDAPDDREHWFGRAHLRWTPMDRLDISFIASILDYNDGAGNMSLTEYGASMFGLPPFEDRKDSANLQGSNKASSNTQSLNMTYDFGNSLILTSVTARRMYNDRSIMDWDFSPMTLMHGDKDNKYAKISQELRLASSSENLKWLVGFYYDHDHNEINMKTDSVFPPMASTKDRDFRGDAYAVFGQINYALTEGFHLIGGLRYEVQEQEYENNILNTTTDDSWNDISPKLALEYHFTPALMTYASVAKGYRSGGFNTVATDPRYASYDEETLWSYEIGSKNAFFDNRLILNGCIFYMDINDMQVTEAVSTMESYLSNAAKATGKGFELEMTAKVTEGLSVMAGFGYTDIEFKTFKDALGDYEGNKNPYAPDYTFNIGVQYRHGSGFYARADVIGCGKMYFDKANKYSRDPYQTVNAKVGYETEHFDFYLYGKNIFDKEYNSYGYYDGYYIIYSDPGEAGVQLVYRF